jgi:hypothetical protein
MQMTAMRMPLPDALAKPINVSNAQPSLLRKQLGLPSDESDINNYIVSEWSRHNEALDAYLGLDTNAPNLREQRVKAIINYEYGVPADSPDWWARLSWKLVIRHIPGFSVGRRGRPRKWAFDDLIALGKDIRTLKARYPDLKGEKLYIALRGRHPKTWDLYGIPALRKAYAAERALARRFPKPTVPPGQAISAPRSTSR